MSLYIFTLLCLSFAILTNGRSLFELNEGYPMADKSIGDGLFGISMLKLVYQSEFTNFKRQYNKVYSSVEEEERRFFNFIVSYITIIHHNELYDKGQKKYKMAINHMSDLSKEEFQKLNGFKSSNKTGSSYLSPSMKIDLPENIDWRDKGAVTKVKQQGNCGSCYAFAATGTLEGQMWKKTGKLISLSEQQIVDCDPFDNGCNGGYVENVLNYIKVAGGIDKEADFPYVSGYTEKRNDKCFFKKDRVVAADTGYVQLPENDEEKLKEAVALIGPVAIAFSATSYLQHYESGIFHDDECAAVDINHAVLVVGYGTDAKTGIPYWLIKNSWGESWGEKGYFRMQRNINACNMGLHSVYPLV